MKIGKNYKDVAMGALGIAGGQVAANYAGKAIDGLSFIPESIQPYAKGGIQALAGVILATKGKKNALVSNAGLGMAATGIKNLVAAIVPSLGIAGVANDPYTYLGEAPTNGPLQPFNTAASSLGSVSSANDAGTWG
jgi:hypothetical protein